jgi:hypothetical protein
MVTWIQEDLQASSTACSRDRPMSESKRSSSSRSCLRWRHRARPRLMSASHADGLCQSHSNPANGFEADMPYWVVQVVVPQACLTSEKWSETTLGCVTADRAVADGPNIMAVSR